MVWAGSANTEPKRAQNSMLPTQQQLERRIALGLTNALQRGALKLRGVSAADLGALLAPSPSSAASQPALLGSPALQHAVLMAWSASMVMDATGLDQAAYQHVLTLAAEAVCARAALIAAPGGGGAPLPTAATLHASADAYALSLGCPHLDAALGGGLVAGMGLIEVRVHVPSRFHLLLDFKL